MSKLNYTKLYMCGFILALPSLFVDMEQYANYFLALLAIAVVTLGLPHGALDFSVAKSLKLVNSWTSTIGFVVIYLIISALAIGFWIWQPSIALFIFLTISILHFSADWRDISSRIIRIGLASIIICGPSLLYAPVVTGIFTDLLLPFDEATWMVKCMQGVLIVSLLLVFGITVCSILQKKYADAWHIAETTLLMVSGIILTPLLHFGLYFCLLHSPKHLYDISELLNTSVKRTVLLSLPFVLFTILLAIGSYAWLGSGVLDVDILRWIFIGLFGLTTSHMMLISVWHRSN